MKSLKEEYKHNAERYSDALNLIYSDDPIEKKLRSKNLRIEKSTLKKCQEIFIVLRETKNLFQIEEFMFHESPHIRCLSAAHCLYSNPDVAESVLEELIESYSGEIRLSALTTLKAWRNIPWTEDRYK